MSNTSEKRKQFDSDDSNSELNKLDIWGISGTEAHSYIGGYFVTDRKKYYISKIEWQLGYWIAISEKDYWGFKVIGSELSKDKPQIFKPSEITLADFQWKDDSAEAEIYLGKLIQFRGRSREVSATWWNSEMQGWYAVLEGGEYLPISSLRTSKDVLDTYTDLIGKELRHQGQIWKVNKPHRDREVVAITPTWHACYSVEISVTEAIKAVKALEAERWQLSELLKVEHLIETLVETQHGVYVIQGFYFEDNQLMVGIIGALGCIEIPFAFAQKEYGLGGN